MKLDERGKACPLPVIETKKALQTCKAGEVVEVLVDNEIAVQNLSKMAKHKQLAVESKQLAKKEYLVKIIAGEEGEITGLAEEKEEEYVCELPAEKNRTVVVISSNEMGSGDPVLGKLLMKGFVYALTEQDCFPDTVLLYNSGAYLSCEGSDSVQDLKELEEKGTEILTCGTCLNHYGLSENLAVGSVTNMYEIVERMMGAAKVVRP